MSMREATITEENGQKTIKFNGWVRWFVGTLWGVIVLVILTLVNNVIANDKESRERDSVITLDYNNKYSELKMMVMEDRSSRVRVEAKIDMMMENQREFKQILKRTAPWERRSNFENGS